MKKFPVISVAIAGAFSFAAIINPMSPQTKPIPGEVMAIAKKSCVKCHAEPGKTLALSHVNLSKWDSYTAVRQSSKAAAMCNMITKGKMPPKKFKEENPDFVMTPAEKKTICDWSSSIQVATK